MTSSEKREIVNELRRELIEVLRAINGFQQKVKYLLESVGVTNNT